MKKKSQELRDKAQQLIERSEALDRLAEAETRDLTESEGAEFDNNMAEVARLIAASERAARLEVGGMPDLTDPDAGEDRALPMRAPNLNLRTRRGDSETRAMAHYIRTGDASGLRAELRASNATDMNIGTPADGGFAVPTGHYQGIIAKRNESMAAGPLGVTRIPGVGTTVNVPAESGSANEFVMTNEAAAYDLDAPVLAQKQMTLKKYTKKIQISEELLYDEDSRLMDFLNNYVGRSLALTHNNALVLMLVTAGNATNVTFTGAVAAAGHIPQIIGALQDEYAENAKFLMRRATDYAYRSLSGNPFIFENTPASGPNGFWGFPIVHTAYEAAIATTAKIMHFGDFSQVGLRENPSFNVLRDPYSSASTGQTNLWYTTRFVYLTLNPAAILCGLLS